MTLPFGIKYFHFCIGRTPFGIQVSMVVLKTFPHLELVLHQRYPSMKAESRLAKKYIDPARPQEVSIS